MALCLLTLTAAAPPPRPGPAPVDPAAKLAGATPAQVRAQFGEPAVASDEGRGALWTYRLEGCALMIFFKDQGRGLRVSGLTAGGRKRGDPTPDVGKCLGGAD